MWSRSAPKTDRVNAELQTGTEVAGANVKDEQKVVGAGEAILGVGWATIGRNVALCSAFSLASRIAVVKAFFWESERAMGFTGLLRGRI